MIFKELKKDLSRNKFVFIFLIAKNFLKIKLIIIIKFDKYKINDHYYCFNHSLLVTSKFITYASKIILKK